MLFRSKIEGFEHENLKLTIARVKPESEYTFKVEEEKQEEREAKRKRDEERGYSDKPKKPFEKDFKKPGDAKKYKAPRARGKKISIKALKPKED